MNAPKILIVDDDPIACQIYSDVLSSVGYIVSQAKSAAEAGDLLSTGIYDLLLTDLLLPDRDGISIIVEAKRRDPSLLAVMITAVDRVDTAIRAIQCGASDYLVKPVGPEVLQLSVSRCLATRQLFNENTQLRQHLSLVETGQRLATSSDHGLLFPEAVSAISRSLGAAAAVLIARDHDGTLRFAASEGTTHESAEELAHEAIAALERGERQLSGGEWQLVLGESVQQGESAAPLNCACLVWQPTGDPSAWSSASFLVRHVELALDNIARMRAAEALAYRDDLTGLQNSRYLHIALDREMARARQCGGTFSVLFADLDHFKQVNDTYGHLAGSGVLVETAAILREQVRDTDVAVRYGGDEYVILLVDTGAFAARRIAERLRATVEAHKFKSAEGLTLTLCIGVATWPDNGDTKVQVLDAADRAMYFAKQTTRNRVMVA